jgi:hypothetical protein
MGYEPNPYRASTHPPLSKFSQLETFIPANPDQSVDELRRRARIGNFVANTLLAEGLKTKSQVWLYFLEDSLFKTKGLSSIPNIGKSSIDLIFNWLLGGHWSRK